MNANYHIVFAGDDKYIKYTATTLFSIIKNTDASKTVVDYAFINNEIYKNDKEYIVQKPEKESYVFHILTDGITSDTQKKLDLLCEECSKNFPMQILIHTASSDVFHDFPSLRKNYLTYYRLKLSEFVTEEVDRVLYLDGDIIVNFDIRALFALDMEDKIIAAAADSQFKRVFPSYHGEADYVHDSFYFNAGVMLINFPEWKKKNIAEKSFEFLRSYAVRNHDQDALNSLVGDIIDLPRSYNVPMNGHYLDEKAKNELPFQSEAWVDVIKKSESLKIIHYMSRKKPWASTGYNAEEGKPDFSRIPFYTYWWFYALQVPAFMEDLRAIKTSSSYISAIRKEERVIKFINANKFFLQLYIWRLNFKKNITPYRQKLEAPFKKIRNKFRARKYK